MWQINNYSLLKLLRERNLFLGKDAKQDVSQGPSEEELFEEASVQSEGFWRVHVL
jgi:hypothetical protein